MLIPRRVLDVAKSAAGKNTANAKPARQNVLFTRKADGTPLAVATDGRQLLGVEWQEMPGTEFPEGVGDVEHVPGFAVQIPGPVCKEAKGLIPARVSVPTSQQVLLEEKATKEGENLRLATTDMETTRRLVPRKWDDSFGEFGDWRAALPKFDGKEISLRLNLDVLEQLLSAVRAVGEKAVEYVDVTISPDRNVPILIRAEDTKAKLRMFGVMLAPEIEGRPMPAEFKAKP